MNSGHYQAQASDQVQFVRIEQLHDGQRLDNYLIRELKGVPRSRIYRLIRRGEIRVNKKRCKPEQRLRVGDRVRFPPISVSEQSDPGQPGEGLQALLRAAILHEDEDLLVINKPAGLAVHAGTGIRLGIIEAMRQMQDSWQHLELAHRLDRDTSGCLAMAKNPRYLKHLQEQFKARTVDKEYLALVHGCWPEDLTEVDLPLQKNELSGGERVVRVDSEGKSACTAMQILERFAQATLLRVRPETGRTHQIRVHCQASGHPLVGDEKYVQRRHKGEAGLLNRYKKLCLHAARLSFRPVGGDTALGFEAVLDKHFQGLLKELREQGPDTL